jgi:hypothetical protein
MPAAELALEVFALALEATKGTPITPPTHWMPFMGSIKPARDKYRTRDSNGTFAEFTRSKTVRAGCTWSGSGGLDPNYAPLLFNMFVKAVTSPTTPTNGVLTRLWTFAPTMAADDIKAATLYGGDPNVQVFQASYCMGNELKISADASGTDAATWDVSGFGRFPTRVTAPTMPAQNVGDLLMPAAMQLWIDTGTIGTTEVTGRFISTDWTIPTGAAEKRYAGGPTGGLNFTKHGRKPRSAKATIVVELNDISIGTLKEYQTWEADSLVKMRIRLNGSLIESVTPDYYSFVQLDIYAPLDNFDWADYDGMNRTMQFEITSEYNAAAGYDFALSVQNARTTL